MPVYQALFIYFCQNIYFLLFFIENLRDLEKNHGLRQFFLIT